MKIEEGVYVKDSLSEVEKYFSTGKYFKKVIAFLQRNDLMKLPNGRYEIDGDNAYAMVQEVNLKPWESGRPEVHHDFFDIHVPISGEETIGVGKFETKFQGDFDADKDVGFYDEVPMEPLLLRPGEFVILYPETCAHAPCCSEDAPGMTLRKIVIKVHK